MAWSTEKCIYPLCMTPADLQPGDSLSALFRFAFYKQGFFPRSVEWHIFDFAFCVCVCAFSQWLYFQKWSLWRRRYGVQDSSAQEPVFHITGNVHMLDKLCSNMSYYAVTRNGYHCNLLFWSMCGSVDWLMTMSPAVFMFPNLSFPPQSQRPVFVQLLFVERTWISNCQK